MRETRRRHRVWEAEESHRRYTEARVQRADAWNRRSLRAFAEWLLSSRGLERSTVTVRVGTASTFVDAMAARAGVSCAPAFRAVTVEAIEDFFIAYGRDHGQASCRSMQTSMRLFLRYAMERGWVGEEMLEAVPSLRSYRLSQVPRGLSDEQLLRLLESPFEHGQCPLRDWAIVCLLATYGVRRAQISRLRLEDIDWRDRSIEFAAHKGGKAIRQWLTDAIAEGLARYLRDERPESSRAFVFLRHRRPYGQLSPSAITERVRSRMVRRGLPPLGPHSLRHTFASRMLRAGRSVKAIADLLGHRSLASVDVYAKVDSARLLEVAVEWPEVGP